MQAKLQAGERLFAEGRIGEARSFFLDLLRKHPNNSDILNNLGVISHTLGEKAEAETYFFKAVSCGIGYSAPLINLVEHNMSDHRWGEAIYQLEAYLEVGEGTSAIYNLLGSIYLETGQIQKGKSALEKSLHLDDSQPDIRNKLQGFIEKDLNGKQGISLCMVIRNEAEFITACLDDIQAYVDEIIIVDQSSDDNTMEIIRNYTDQIFNRPNVGFCEPDRQFSIDRASAPWVLVLDADERLDSVVKAGLRSVGQSGFDAFWMERKDYIDGRLYDSGKPDLQLRLFKKEAITWPTEMHAYPVVHTDKVCRLDNGKIFHVRSFERIKEVHMKRNRFVDDRMIHEHDRFVHEVEMWLQRGETSVNDS